MKKTLLLSGILLTSFSSFGQSQQDTVVIDGSQPYTLTTKIGQPKYEYCELLGVHKFLSSKVTISVDYGQERNFWTYGRDSRIKDAEGKVQNFESMVDGLNFMGKFGWEFVQAYVVTVGNQNVYHWLLKRSIEN